MCLCSYVCMFVYGMEGGSVAVREVECFSGLCVYGRDRCMRFGGRGCNC